MQSLGGSLSIHAWSRIVRTGTSLTQSHRAQIRWRLSSFTLDIVPAAIGILLQHCLREQDLRFGSEIVVSFRAAVSELLEYSIVWFADNKLTISAESVRSGCVKA
jgi:hypothetical protein